MRRKISTTARDIFNQNENKIQKLPRFSFGCRCLKSCSEEMFKYKLFKVFTSALYAGNVQKETLKRLQIGSCESAQS